MNPPEKEPNVPDDIELPGIPDSIVRGSASDDELAEFLGADLMNRLAAQWRGPQQSRRLFAHWYVDVMKPLGIALEPAFQLFTGETTIDAFVDTLSEEMLDTFIENYPVLQARHQAASTMAWCRDEQPSDRRLPAQGHPGQKAAD